MEIVRFCIKESGTDLQSIVSHKQNAVPDNVFFFVTESGAFEDDNYLKDITNQIFESIEAEQTATKPMAIPKITENNKKIFVVHGHDDAMRLEVDAFVRKIQLEPIVLGEQPTLGSTIIEKIEANSNISYAIILYSACDVGARKGDVENLKDRARQNVVFEHGYFIAKLGRERVVAVVRENVEFPSDISGMVYTIFDKAGGWKMKIVQELKALGYQVNANDLF